jgi:hypothetical protein
MKGQLPKTGRITLESTEPEWRLITNNIINEIQTSGLIERSPGDKVRIKLIINKIIPPETVVGSSICRVESNIETGMELGFTRTRKFLNDFIGQRIWIFMGHIVGEEKKPILIIYYEVIKVCIYTQKLINEEAKTFFQYPSLN